MKIARVENLFIDRFLFVRVETECGLVGVGESGAWGHLEASGEAVAKFSEYLVGRDPRTIEHHWNVMHRFQNFSGAAINGAISAIDVALWDIKARSYNVPIFELLGGAMRRSVRLYSHCKGRTSDALFSRAERMVSEGFNALGCMNPLLEEDSTAPWFKSVNRKVKDAADNVRTLRERVGDDVDLCIEIHSRMSVAEAITFAQSVEEYRPMFIEDPIPPYNLDAMATVADKIRIPIATGERFINLQQFQMLLARRGVHYLRPCISVCGGITAGKKIAALAEAHGAEIVFHNPLSPINLAACLHLDAAIPNFAVQEYPFDNETIEGSEGLRGSKIIEGLTAPENGFLKIPDGPGLGLELPDDAVEKFPRRSKKIEMRPHVDGSVIDQ